MWAIGGRGRMQTGAFSGRAEPGSLMLLPRGRFQDYGSDPDQPWDLTWMHFAGTAADAWVRTFEARFGLLVTLGTPPELVERFTELVTAAHGGPAERRLADHLGWGLLGRIEYRLTLGPPGSPANRAQALERVQRYVSEHLAERITTGDLAAVARVSPRHLTRLCRAAWGVSPMAYVAGQRLARACSLLSETEMPVGAVAEAAGYSDPYHFSRHFRRRMGEPPRAYRQRRRAGNAPRKR